MARLFGTDGVRGVANENLTPELAFKLGQAAGIYFQRGRGTAEERPRVIIGKDTRISGDMLEAALMSGLTSVGVDVYRLGVLPTPGVAFLCRRLGSVAGVMISASHNPVEDNESNSLTIRVLNSPMKWRTRSKPYSAPDSSNSNGLPGSRSVRSMMPTTR